LDATGSFTYCSSDNRAEKIIGKIEKHSIYSKIAIDLEVSYLEEEDVLLPLMLDQYVARPTDIKMKTKNPNAIKINKSDLLTGYGIVRAIPGLFFGRIICWWNGTFTRRKMQLIGCLIGTIALFLPSALLLFSSFLFGNI
jgi:hypothetical protein